MWKSKRRQRNNNWRKKFFVFFILLLILCLVTSTFLLYSKVFKKSVLLSPIPVLKPSAKEQLSQSLKNKKISFSSIDVASDSSYLVRLSTGEEVILSSNKNIASQVASLQLVLSRLTIEGKGFTRLDFRFEKPIIIFK